MAGNLISDAHLAALAVENGATVLSADNDFKGHCQVNEAVTRSGKCGAVSSLILKQWSPRSKPQRHGHEATGSCGVEVGVGQALST